MEEYPQSKRSAAVLIPILLRGDQYHVPFTQRSHMNPHLSQPTATANTPHIHCIEYNDFFIWGVTATILKDFAMTNIEKVLGRVYNSLG